MTYAETARKRWGGCFYAWLRGWQDAETGAETDYRADYPKQAYREGRNERRALGAAHLHSLAEQGI